MSMNESKTKLRCASKINKYIIFYLWYYKHILLGVCSMFLWSSFHSYENKQKSWHCKSGGGDNNGDKYHFLSLVPLCHPQVLCCLCHLTLKWSSCYLFSQIAPYCNCWPLHSSLCGSGKVTSYEHKYDLCGVRGKYSSCCKDKVMFSPIGVVLWQRVGDVGSGHQQEGPHKVYDTAGRQKEERVAQRDSLFIQNLENKKTNG